MTFIEKSHDRTVVYPTLEPDGAARAHIAVLMGGLSSEREVSLSSAKGIVTALIGLRYRVTPVDMGRDVAACLQTLAPDLVFNALHGTHGEDGCVPGMLEILGLRYTHAGVLASAIGMDKVRAKALFRNHGIMCPGGVVLSKKDAVLQDPLPRPYVIKPVSQGSSVGVHVVFPRDNFALSEYDWAYGDTVLVEPYIPGKEIHVAVVGNKAIGAIEICPNGRFYNYEAKYTDGKAAHIMPADLPPKAYEEVLDLALQAHQIIGCKSVSRSDFRYNPDENGGTFYLLEINTHPGMTPLSLVPEIAAHGGITFPELLECIIQDVYVSTASSLPMIEK